MLKKIALRSTLYGLLISLTFVSFCLLHTRHQTKAIADQVIAQVQENKQKWLFAKASNDLLREARSAGFSGWKSAVLKLNIYPPDVQKRIDEVNSELDKDFGK